MKALETLTIATLLILGTTILLSAGFIQIPMTQSGPFTERHNVNLGYPSPSTYTINAGSTFYLTYNLRHGTLVKATMTISGGSGDDINFYIRDSAGSTVFNPGRVSHTYSYQLTAPKDDVYRIYMDNSFSVISSKTVNYRVTEAYYTETVSGPRTTHSALGEIYPWLQEVGIGAILIATGIIAFFGMKSLNDRRLKENQARAEQEVRLKAEQQLAAEREQQRLRKEEEQRRLAMKQNADNLMKAGRYEDAARLYEELEMWGEAGECRRLARTTYVVAADVHVGKDGLSVNCPHCGSSERLESKVSEVTCRHCGKTYYIPKKILDMI